MNDRQRVVLVVALGAAAVVGATTASRLLGPDGGGWFAYAPNTSVVFRPSSGWIWRDVLIWLAAIVVWAATSFWLLRRGDDGR